MMRRYLPLLFIALACLASCERHSKEAKTSPPPIPVRVVQPTVKDLTHYVESIGVLQPDVSLVIRSQVEGQLRKVLVDEGQEVKEGTPLFEIDPTSYQIALQEANAQVAIDMADYKSVASKLERFKDLAGKDLIAQTEWDDLNTQSQKAQATVMLSQARLKAAKLKLERCIITSPIAARVGQMDVSEWNLVSQNDPLVTLTQLDPLIVEFKVTEKESRLLKPDQRAIEIVSLCDGTSCGLGKLTFLDHHFDVQTGLLTVHAEVPNTDYKLRPGQSMAVRLPVSVTANTLLIPQKAIRYNQEGPFVYVVQVDQTVALRPLVVGKEEGKDQVVLQGLDPNEKIVVDGHLRLSPGVKAEIKP